MTAADQLLMRAQVAAEVALHDKLYVSRASLYALLNSLAGIASNATQCGACRMGVEIADEALNRFEASTGISREIAYRSTHRHPPALPQHDSHTDYEEQHPAPGPIAV